jgi:N-acetylglucosaminyldiphosphoundecaprenol N-acetyl-beta-D-mannosaminyltransferase
MKKGNQVEILGVLVDNLTLEEAINQVGEMMRQDGSHLVVTPYSESIVLAQSDSHFRKVINQADLSIPDGISLKAVASYLNMPAKNIFQALANGFKVGWRILTDERRLTGLKAQVSGVDLLIKLCQEAALRKWRVFFLGGQGEVAKKSAANLKKKLPDLIIKTWPGSKDITQETPQERKAILERINQFQPDLLFVAYGHGIQEKWLKKNLPQLKVKVAMGVGGAFDYFSGKVPRAPAWMRERGLEWFYRLIRQPWRLRRQLTIFYLLWLVFQAKRQKLST